jgi:hypothetical protein
MRCPHWMARLSTGMQHAAVQMGTTYVVVQKGGVERSRFTVVIGLGEEEFTSPISLVRDWF